MLRLKTLLWLTVLAIIPAAYAAGPVDDLLQSYRQSGAANFSTSAGKQLWTKTFQHPGTGKSRSCATCHGEDLGKNGKHTKTGKTIKPLAPSVNANRLTDSKKMQKWLKRNCKWTMGRECTPQEKGDVLTYLRTL